MTAWWPFVCPDCSEVIEQRDEETDLDAVERHSEACLPSGVPLLSSGASVAFE